MKRPIGITLCAVFLLLCVLPAFLVGWVIALSGPTGGRTASEAGPPPDVMIRIVFLLIPVFLLGAGY